jgi:nucleoid-associated protein YgaU
MFVPSYIGRILLLALAVLLVWAFFAGESGAGGPERSYRVKPGDTLWSIAERTFAGDPREGVWELRERNGLDSTTITPGQVLVVPT